MVKFCQCLSLATSKLLPWRQDRMKTVMLLASLSSIGEQYIKSECWVRGGGRGGGGGGGGVTRLLQYHIHRMGMLESL